MTIPWSELTDQLDKILVEDAIERSIKQDRVQLQAAARARASELVNTEIIPDTRKIIQEVTMSAIVRDANAGDLLAVHFRTDAAATPGYSSRYPTGGFAILRLASRLRTMNVLVTMTCAAPHR